MTYRCRFTAPRPSDWSTVEADSPEDAAQEFHFRDGDKSSSPHSIAYVPDEQRPGARIFFARVEVDGHGELVSRCYSSAILRRGGVKPQRVTLEAVARAVGWEHDPADLVDEGWDREESAP